MRFNRNLNLFAYFIMTVSTILFATIVTLVTSAAVPPSKVDHTDTVEYLTNLNVTKIILDVDAGVDDALGILLILAKQRPNYPEIVAITCTHGNTKLDNVVINVLKTLRALDRQDIPVFIGAYASLTVTPEGDSFFGKDGFGDVPDNDPPCLEDAEKEHAVSAMIRLAAENKDEIAVVATGPLTNVALAIRMDKEFKNNLKALYWMGGSVEGIGNIKPGIEFNAYMDPEANFITFNTSGPQIIILSWETCKIHAAISKQWRLDVLGSIESKLIEFLNSIEAESLSKSSEWSPCDAVLISSILDRRIIKKATALHIDPVYQGDARGALLVDYKEVITPKNAIIIQDTNPEFFKELCLDNLK